MIALPKFRVTIVSAILLLVASGSGSGQLKSGSTSIAMRAEVLPQTSLQAASTAGATIQPLSRDEARVTLAADGKAQTVSIPISVQANTKSVLIVAKNLSNPTASEVAWVELSIASSCGASALSRRMAIQGETVFGMISTSRCGATEGTVVVTLPATAGSAPIQFSLMVIAQ